MTSDRPCPIPVHHPGEELWLDYVAGQLDTTSRCLLEAHLAFCPACRDRAAEAAAPGAELLAEGSAEAAPPGLLQAVLASLQPPAPPQVGPEALPLPVRLWPLLPDLTRAAWRGALVRGLRFLQVPALDGPGLYLIHLEKGRGFPRHRHAGLERSVILCGGLSDAGTILEAGDFDEATPQRTHHPVALPDEDCWLLATMERDPLFTGWRGWLQAKFAPTQK